MATDDERGIPPDAASRQHEDAASRQHESAASQQREIDAEMGASAPSLEYEELRQDQRSIMERGILGAETQRRVDQRESRLNDREQRADSRDLGLDDRERAADARDRAADQVEINQATRT